MTSAPISLSLRSLFGITPALEISSDMVTDLRQHPIQCVIIVPVHFPQEQSFCLQNHAHFGSFSFVAFQDRIDIAVFPARRRSSLAVLISSRMIPKSSFALLTYSRSLFCYFNQRVVPGVSTSLLGEMLCRIPPRPHRPHSSPGASGTRR